MAARGFLSVFTLAFLIVAASATAPQPQHAEEMAAFSYSGSSGPGKWGSLSPGFSECAIGKEQSPVDIVKNQTVLNKNLGTLIRDYSPVNATLVNNGFNIGVIFEGDIGALNLDGKKYSLKQIHWHTPSEHRINGIQYPAELHLLHKTSQGSIAVIAILFAYGDPDPILTKIEKELKELANEVCAADEESHIALGIFSPKHLKRNTRKYYRYTGSTTTPPCTESVTWNVLGKVRTISKEQVEALRAPLKGDCKNNCRPLQPLNGRKIELYDELNGKEDTESDTETESDADKSKNGN